MNIPPAPYPPIYSYPSRPLFDAPPSYDPFRDILSPEPLPDHPFVDPSMIISQTPAPISTVGKSKNMVISHTPAPIPSKIPPLTPAQQMVISDTPLNFPQQVLQTQAKQGGGQLSPILEANEEDQAINDLTLNQLISDTMTPANVETKRGNQNKYLTPATPLETPIPLHRNIETKRGNQAKSLTPATPLEIPPKSKQASISAGELVVVKSKKQIAAEKKQQKALLGDEIKKPSKQKHSQVATMYEAPSLSTPIKSPPPKKQNINSPYPINLEDDDEHFNRTDYD